MHPQRAQALGKRLSRCPAPQRLRLAQQIVGSGGGVYRRACFKVKRGECRASRGRSDFREVMGCGLH